MNDNFRRSMAWLHTWSGLLVGWVLYFVFLTGSTGYFDAEIDRWMRPELPLPVLSRSAEETVAHSLKRLEAVAPGAERWRVELPNRNAEPAGGMFWRMRTGPDGSSESYGSEALDSPGTTPVQPRRTGGGQFLYQMHYRLHYLEAHEAAWIVGFCSMFMLVAILTGVIAHKRIFRDFFTFRPRKGQRSWLDAHNVLSVMALPFHLMITYSGLVFFMFTYMPHVLDEVYRLDERDQSKFFDYAYPPEPRDLPRTGIDKPLTSIQSLLQASAALGGGLISVSVRNPGDASARIIITRERTTPQSDPLRIVYDGVTGAALASGPVADGAHQVNATFIGLHEGLFAGPVLRWLYFLSGLMGTAMIATGLVVWTCKRRAKQQDSVQVSVVERLNAATILGLPIGIAVYFWANRLLPLGIEARGSWEANALFGGWVLVFIHITLRPVMRVWIELLGCASALFGLLPVLNALTTDRHLGITLPHAILHGDWALAGFDFTALTVGAIFGVVAWRLRTRKEISVHPAEQTCQPS